MTTARFLSQSCKTLCDLAWPFSSGVLYTMRHWTTSVLVTWACFLLLEDIILLPAFDLAHTLSLDPFLSTLVFS